MRKGLSKAIFSTMITMLFVFGVAMHQHERGHDQSSTATRKYGHGLEYASVYVVQYIAKAVEVISREHARFAGWTM